MSDPVVFVPGLMADGRVFDVALRTISHRRPVQLFLPVGADNIAELARDLLRTAPPRFSAIGHGLGGFVALEAARNAPERLVSLILVNSTAQPERPAAAAEMEAHLVKGTSGGLYGAIREMTGVDRMADGRERREIELLQGEMAFDLGQDVFATQLRAIQQRPDQQPGLHRLAVQTLILAGELDPLYPPRSAEILASLLPRARAEIIRGAGHMMPLELPRRLTEIIEDFVPKPLVLK